MDGTVFIATEPHGTTPEQTLKIVLGMKSDDEDSEADALAQSKPARIQGGVWGKVVRQLKIDQAHRRIKHVGRPVDAFGANIGVTEKHVATLPAIVVAQRARWAKRRAATRG
jgi:hypothetical protein